MEKAEFLQLKQGDKVQTNDFGTAYIYDWSCSKLEVLLFEFDPPKPLNRCTEFTRQEIKCKLDE